MTPGTVNAPVRPEKTPFRRPATIPTGMVFFSLSERDSPASIGTA